MSDVKMWGSAPYGGLGYDFDPQWYLTEEQKALQAKLIELCRTTLRPNAVEFDRNGTFPRKNMEALASLGLLSLHVPTTYGGMGQSREPARAQQRAQEARHRGQAQADRRTPGAARDREPLRPWLPGAGVELWMAIDLGPRGLSLRQCEQGVLDLVSIVPSTGATVVRNLREPDVPCQGLDLGRRGLYARTLVGLVARPLEDAKRTVTDFAIDLFDGVLARDRCPIRCLQGDVQRVLLV